jgi:hypothetical protein
MMTKFERVAAAVGVTLVLMLTGCAVPVGPSDAAPPPSPTPTAACPQVEGVELPPDCAPYDPEKAMALNDRYRDRVDIDGETREASAAVVDAIRADLDELRISGAASVDTVQAALANAGLADAQVREDYGDFLFGVGGIDGGCIFGEVSEEAVSVEIGGYILDGGCLPAQ